MASLSVFQNLEASTSNRTNSARIGPLIRRKSMKVEQEQKHQDKAKATGEAADERMSREWQRISKKEPFLGSVSDVVSS